MLAPATPAAPDVPAVVLDRPPLESEPPAQSKEKTQSHVDHVAKRRQEFIVAVYRVLRAIEAWPPLYRVAFEVSILEFSSSTEVVNDLVERGSLTHPEAGAKAETGAGAETGANSRTRICALACSVLRPPAEGGEDRTVAYPALCPTDFAGI
jgi:hypothetical protein